MLGFLRCRKAEHLLNAAGFWKIEMALPPHTRIGPVQIGKLHPEDDALELMYFGSRGMTRRADRYLATLGLSRVHHRILYTVARGGGMSVTDLLIVLSLSKQALHRPMKQLVEKNYVEITRDPTRHRYKVLNLTA